jgi:predicted nucleic acid-binding protein
MRPVWNSRLDQVFDLDYIACAEVLDSELVTADKRLWKATRETDHAHLVRHLDGSRGSEH